MEKEEGEVTFLVREVINIHRGESRLIARYLTWSSCFKFLWGMKLRAIPPPCLSFYPSCRLSSDCLLDLPDVDNFVFAYSIWKDGRVND